MIIDYYKVKQAALVLRAVNNKLRQQIVALISENKSMTVTEIYVKLRLEQSVASQHLAILRKANVVGTKRDGKFIFYFLNLEKLKLIEAQALELIK